MFVLASNKSLENDEIRTLKQTSLKNGNILPACFNSTFGFHHDLRISSTNKIDPIPLKEK